MTAMQPIRTVAPTSSVAYVQLDDGAPVHLVTAGRMYFAAIHGFREASATERARHAWPALCGAEPRPIHARWMVLAGPAVEGDVCARCRELAQ